MNCPVRRECKLAGTDNRNEGIWGGKFLDGGKVV